MCVWSSMCVCACSSTCEDVDRPLCMCECSHSSMCGDGISHVVLFSLYILSCCYSSIPSLRSSPSYSSCSCCLNNSSYLPHSSSCFCTLVFLIFFLSSFISVFIFSVIVFSSSSPSPSGVMFWHLFPSDERDRSLRNIVDTIFPPQQVIWMQLGWMQGVRVGAKRR